MELQGSTQGQGREKHWEVFSYVNPRVPAHSPKQRQVQNNSFSSKSTDNKKAYSLKPGRDLPSLLKSTR